MELGRVYNPYIDGVINGWSWVYIYIYITPTKVELYTPPFTMLELSSKVLVGQSKARPTRQNFRPPFSRSGEEEFPKTHPG